MQMRALEVFVEVARSNSIRQAANRLGVTPTSITRHIDHLEYYFRTKLIDRSSNGVGLTEAGQLLGERARSIVVDAETTRALIDDLRGLQRGTATIRASGAVVASLLSPVLCDLHARYPGLRFHVDVASAGDVVSAVADGTADLGLTMFAPENTKAVICQSFRISHAAIMSPRHRLAHLPNLSMQQLAREKLAIPDFSFGVRTRLDQVARNAGARLDPVFVTGSLALQIELAIRGAAVLVLPPLACQREIDSGLLVAVDLADGSAVETSLDLCKSPNRTLTFTAQTLLQALAEHISAAVE